MRKFIFVFSNEKRKFTVFFFFNLDVFFRVCMMRRILLLFLLTFNFFLLTFNFFLLNIIIRLLELLSASISGKKSSSLLAFITSFIVRFSTIFVIFKKSLLYFYFKLEKYWLDFHIQLSLNHFFNFIFKFKKEITQF